MRALFDTNILIDYLGGVEDARQELARFESSAISRITWMEVLVGASDESEAARLRSFLARFECIDIDETVSDLATGIRREYRLRLPDAIIWASAQSVDGLLVTRNARDFPADDPSIRVPYATEGQGR